MVRCDGGRNWILLQLITIIILRVLSGDPGRYGAATSRVFAIYENFPGKIMSVLLEHNYLFFLISNP
ncbi:hypothetical protein DEN91_26215 [Escherichia coli]|nr:hypothetical protein COD55_26340 [Escherichia coli]TFX58131.1 hypothetical protein DEO02_26080 [Escherichia coli]TFY01271.1 hypothetical protein DEN91_26215 [Escherichia coli]TFY15603.1 hypothetical protein DEN92_26925 [Escherichia coli]